MNRTWRGTVVVALAALGCAADVPERPPSTPVVTQRPVVVSVVDEAGAPVQGAVVRAFFNTNRACGKANRQGKPKYVWAEFYAVTPANGMVTIRSREPLPWLEVLAEGTRTRFEKPVAEELVVTVRRTPQDRR